MTDSLLIVEGRHADVPSFAQGLHKKGFEVHVFTSGNAAVSRLDKINPSVVVVNAASLHSSGLRICQALREKNSRYPIILILAREAKVSKAIADVVLVLPFTIQKLTNRIKPLLPGEGKDILHVGPIWLDVEHRRVKCLGKNTKLTPRLVLLLRTLMDKHGEVVERDVLFKKVWDTNYTGDTRTLDVHISWLRRAIEVEPLKPRFLKTVRGVGYCLDV